jgi:DNA-binding transcriptional regulator YiaG
MNREQIAHAVGVDANVVAQWEDGAVEIRCPRAVEQILRQEITERQMLRVER